MTPRRSRHDKQTGLGPAQLSIALSRGTEGLPGPDALADFLIAIGPCDGSETFRSSEVTFDPPD